MWPERIEVHAVANPAIIADFDFPWELHADRRTNFHIMADPGPEQPEYEPSPTVHDLGRGMDQQRLGNPPDLHHERRATPKAFGQAETGQVLEARFGPLI